MSALASVSVLDLGYYEAARAAALSGVPRSTVYDWHRTGLVVPSGSRTQEMLWSYADLLKLRLVRWLRTEKEGVARSKMSEIRAMMEQLGDRLWDDTDEQPQATIRVTRSGKVIRVDGPRATLTGQLLMDSVHLFAPLDGSIDLRRPRPGIRIHPGRVAGEPHLLHSRLTTRAVAGLARRGLSLALITELYPKEDPDALADALDLEASLGTLTAAA